VETLLRLERSRARIARERPALESLAKPARNGEQPRNLDGEARDGQHRGVLGVLAEHYPTASSGTRSRASESVANTR